MNRSSFLLLLALAAAAPALAQTPGTCQTGQAERNLDISGVRATLYNTGALFLDEEIGGRYEVPLGVGASPIYTAGLWVAGHSGGDLRTAGSRYADFEFWPGPLSEDGTLPNPTDCSAFDRIFVVSALDIAAFEEGNGVTDDLAEWPVEIGAPVIAAPDNGFDDDGDDLVDEGTDGLDNDGDGLVDEHDEQELVVVEVREAAGLSPYDLSAGDRPEVLGTQTAFWVMNDVGNEHAETGTLPIGLEVRVSAFAIGIDDPTLVEQTFYRYTFVKKTPGSLDDTYVSLFFDTDLGDSTDDYVGSDTTRSLAFAYNANPTDAVYGVPPAVGLDVFRGPTVDADFDGEVDDTLAASRVMYFNNVGDLPTGDPSGAVEYYNIMQSLWPDGTPLTEGGDGYMTNGPVVPFAFPGDPVITQFWSEINTGDEPNPPDDRRLVVSVGPFDMESGEVHTLDVGLLFAQSDNHLASVTELRAVSDAAQARYDGGTLFAPFDAPPPVNLGIPALTAPVDGAVFTGTPPTLTWTAVPGALRYRVERATTPDFQNPELFFSLEPELSLAPETFPANESITYYWRVRAERYGSVGSYPPPRSFTYYRYEFDTFGNGAGIIETAYPGADPCPDADDPGCEQGYPGNTVWLDPNSTGDYVITAPDNILANGSSGLGRYFGTIDGDDFELRFTEDCATFGACLGIYDIINDGEIVSLPFELWNLQDPDTSDDDVRMIPVLLTDGEAPATDWADYFGTTMDVIAGSDTLELPITDRIYWMMPDRPSGYAQFAAAANAAGGSGALYPYENDPDTQIDINPDTDEPCFNQGVFIDYCYRGAGVYVYPIGRMFVADLAGDGTTPPAGTTVRFDANDRLLDVGAEGDTPEASPQAFALEAAYPNPFASTATVGYRLEQSAEVRLAVYDVLGRRVAVLVDGEATAGSHRARFDGAGLASGVYLVVLEADGQRQAKKVMLVR